MHIPARRLAALALLAACGPFVPDTTGPGPGPGPGTDGPTGVAIPFRLGSTGPEEGRGIVTSGTGVILASWFAGTVDFDPQVGATNRISFGVQDVAVARYNETGEFDWVFNFGGALADVPTAIAATADGGAVLVGFSSGGGNCGGAVLPSAGGRDVLVLKLSATGVCEWGYLLGGPEDDEARAVVVAGDGSIYIAGFFAGLADFDPIGTTVLVAKGGTDGFLIRLTAAGELDGAVQGGGTDADRFNTLASAPDGELAVGGEFLGTASYGSSLAPVVLLSAGGTDGVLARYTAQLGLRWATRIGGLGEDRVLAVASDPSGDVLTAGTFETTTDLDPNAGSALVVSKGAADIFLARYTATAGVWDGLALSLGGAGAEGLSRMVQDPSGRLLLTGYFEGTVDFDPGSGVKLVVARGTGGAGDAFLLSLAEAGDLGWVVPIGGAVGGGNNRSIGYDLAVDPADRVWTTGRFFGRADFDPGPEATELAALTDSDIFVSRYRLADGSLATEPLPTQP